MTQRQLWMIRSFCFAIFMLCFSGIAGAQLSDMRIGLVAPGVGWVVQNQGTQPNPNHHLYWTANDGENWTDITPQDPASSQIAGVFFLDASRGWVLLALTREPKKGNQESVDFVTDISGFDLASTADGGASWAIKPLSSLAEGVGWTAAAQIFFLDGAHGWMSIESPVPHWGGEGVLLATTDGGNTWKGIEEVNGGGGYGAIRFTDLQNGWIAGGPGDQYLYATNDGGRHWREVAVEAPPEVSGLFENVAALYVSPRFNNSKQGFLPVKYSGPSKSGDDVTVLVLFSTSDGGRTWHSESWVNLGEDRGVLASAFTVVDSQALAPKLSSHAALTLMKLRPGGKVTQTEATGAAEMPNNAALLGLSFSDATHGWALRDGRLLSTADGGVAWKDITPGEKKTSTLELRELRDRRDVPSYSSWKPNQRAAWTNPNNSSKRSTYKSAGCAARSCVPNPKFTITDGIPALRAV